MDDFEMILEESLKNPEFKKEWEAGQIEYEIMRMLVKARNEKNLTQKELSELSGIRQSNISRIERGVCAPSINTLEAIANALGKKLKIEFV